MNRVSLETLTSLKKTKILFDNEGRPALALIPLQSQSSKAKDISQILKESSQNLKSKGISQDDLLSELGTVRGEIYRKYYGKKTKSAS